mgnify:CR=1 FL=1
MPSYDSCQDISDVNDNSCVGYENDVEYTINDNSYCTKPGSSDPKNKCKKYEYVVGDEANCFTGKFPNLHACVAKTEG